VGNYMSGANQQKLVGEVRCRRCGRIITNPKNIRLWERNGGYGHGCWDKIRQELIQEQALNASMDLWIVRELEHMQAKELPIKGGVFSEV